MGQEENGILLPPVITWEWLHCAVYLDSRESCSMLSGTNWVTHPKWHGWSTLISSLRIFSNIRYLATYPICGNGSDWRVYCQPVYCISERNWSNTRWRRMQWML